MARIIWTTPALTDLEDLLHHIAKDSLVYAQQFGSRLVESVDRLELYPRSGRVPPEFEDERGREIRQLIHGPYRILYEVRGDDCFIAAIIHASRDILRHIDPKEWDF
jgi:toxin ParE1/3/4